jgi:hypothetical protein
MVGIRRRSLAIATPLNLHYKKNRKNRLITLIFLEALATSTSSNFPKMFTKPNFERMLAK